MRDRRGQSLAEALSRQICQMVINRQLKSGDFLPAENQLTAEFSVGRSTLREAIVRLRALDIVDVRHGHGTFVANVPAAVLHSGPRHMNPIEDGVKGQPPPTDTLRKLGRELAAIKMQLHALGHEDIVSLLKLVEDRIEDQMTPND